MSPIVRLAFALALIAAPSARAATFADLSGGADLAAYSGYTAGPYAAAPYGPCACPPPATGERAYAGVPSLPYAQPGPYAPYSGAYQSSPNAPLLALGQEGMPPSALETPGFGPPVAPPAYPPSGPAGSAPGGPLQLATFQQVNSTTDPYNAWGLSTPFMFVPWSTPLSGWTNAQTWNWWRERSGAPSYGW